MNRRLTAAPVLGAALILSVASAHAGPCTAKIAQFEKVVRQSASTPGAGPTASQTIGAQLGHQPTPGSVRRAEGRAQATFESALARARRLDARGNRAGCTSALAEAKRRFSLQ
jgi:hypothetical protein